MSTRSLLSLQPTFLQGFVVGQISILLLLALILKYLFFESAPPGSPTVLAPLPSPRSQQRDAQSAPLDAKQTPASVDVKDSAEPRGARIESVEWFNLIIREIVQSYRIALRDGLGGLAGDEVVRQRVEHWINDHIGSSFIDPVFIESVTLGTSAPRLSNPRILPLSQHQVGPPDIQFDAEYTDAVSVRLTTSLFFNQPVPAFARLPVSLSLTLDAFRATLHVSPPDPRDPHPSMAIKLHPEFTLSLQTSSLLGSRAKLANVPKVHELIENRLRKALIDRGTVRIRIPGHAERIERDSHPPSRSADAHD